MIISKALKKKLFKINVKLFFFNKLLKNYSKAHFPIVGNINKHIY